MTGVEGGIVTFLPRSPGRVSRRTVSGLRNAWRKDSTDLGPRTRGRSSPGRPGPESVGMKGRHQTPLVTHRRWNTSVPRTSLSEVGIGVGVRVTLRKSARATRPAETERTGDVLSETRAVRDDETQVDGVHRGGVDGELLHDWNPGGRYRGMARTAARNCTSRAPGVNTIRPAPGFPWVAAAANQMGCCSSKRGMVTTPSEGASGTTRSADPGSMGETGSTMRIVCQSVSKTDGVSGSSFVRSGFVRTSG